jgi:fructose-1,6-bisphosphatase-3
MKRLAVDHLHIVGDIFDRGPRPDKILDAILTHSSLDIQWGNHDIVWMGAAAGSPACIAVALSNSILYYNFEFLEEGYGIILRPLALFSEEIYKYSNIDCFIPKDINEINEFILSDTNLTAKMNKALAIIRFKLEGQIIKRHPEFNMDERLLLHKIDYSDGTVEIDGKTYKMLDTDFPTINRDNPYELSAEESILVDQLKSAFLHSEKLQKHIRFMYENGSLYKCYNSNLLLHGCIPLNDDGSLMEFNINGQKLSGKKLLDFADTVARNGYFSAPNSEEKLYGEDFLWFLWCGKNSPFFGKDKMTTFEQFFIDDPEAHEEKKNAYFTFSETEEGCKSLLENFGLTDSYSHIINGHIPVRSKEGQMPVRANGRLIVIDGGFCKAYQPKTGIAGYTLIYNSQGMRLCAHEPFGGTKQAIKNNKDIHSTSVISEKVADRIKVSQTDKGSRIKSYIEDLRLLVSAYREGLLKERYK